MNQTNNPKLKTFSQKLRREMTKEERHLWYDFLKDLPMTVNRQKVIGAYIADFYCAAAKCVIELDGAQHYAESGRKSDEKRDACFKTLGIRVLRYSNEDIHHNFEGVCADIWKHFNTSSVTA